MAINPIGNNPYEGHAKINLDKLLNDPSIDPQSMAGYSNFIMTLSLTKVLEVLNSSRNYVTRYSYEQVLTVPTKPQKQEQ